jgi:hypothetical protein
VCPFLLAHLQHFLVCANSSSKGQEVQQMPLHRVEHLHCWLLVWKQEGQSSLPGTGPTAA